MRVEDQWRVADLPIAPPRNAPSLLDDRANHRMAELLNEAEQERLARLARGVRRAGSDRPGWVAQHRPIHSALMALAAFACRLAIHRPERTPS
jgi:hypothetical protein